MHLPTISQQTGYDVTLPSPFFVHHLCVSQVAETGSVNIENTSGLLLAVPIAACLVTSKDGDLIYMHETK